MSRGRPGGAAPTGGSAEPGGPWLQPEEVQRLLILPAPVRPDPAFPETLARALEGGRVAAVLLDPVGLASELVAACRERCRTAGVALFLEGDPAAVIAHAADGVLLRAVEAIEPARRLLGLERPIGVATGGSRHAAMEAGEAGGDWLLLGEGLSAERRVELVGWWSGLFVLPCAAPCPGPEEAGALLAAGCDFLIPPATIWTGPVPGLAPFRTALAAG